MRYKINKKLMIVFAVLVINISLTGCATYTKLVSDKKITIEHINSIHAKITLSGLYTTEPDVILLRGKLKRRIFQSGAIPGHLDIELLNLNGVAFKKAKVRYWQQGGKYSDSTFSVPFQIDPVLVSGIRITHHMFGSHTAVPKKSLWQDISKTEDIKYK